MAQSVWVGIYLRLVQRGKKTIKEVPVEFRAAVEEMLEGDTK